MVVKSSSSPSAREKLLDVALGVIRTKGYSATSVDDLCRAAGVTKGAFFHHFKTKEALGVAAADYWAETTGQFFASAAYHQFDDPLERVLGYVDFRRDILQGDIAEFTCLVGTMVQETYQSAPAIGAACRASIFDHASTLEADIALAMTRYDVTSDWTPKSLALHTQAVLQGGFILAKASGDVALAKDSTAHLRRYIELLFKAKS